MQVDITADIHTQDTELTLQWQLSVPSTAKDPNAVLEQKSSDSVAEFGGLAKCGKFGEKRVMPNPDLAMSKLIAKDLPMHLNSLTPKVNDVR